MDKKEKSVLNLTLPADFFYLPAVRSFVREIALTAGLLPGEADKMTLAVDEAVSNVIEHALLPEDKDVFDIVCKVSPFELEVVVKDKGYPFSPEKVEEFSVEEILKGKEPSGLGLFLMKHSVDDITFHNNGFGGKEVCLIKYIDHKHIEKYFKDPDVKPYEKPSGPVQGPAKKISYRVELLNTENAIEVSQCAYRTYVYNYVHELIYYPERIAEMNKSKKLISAVAINEDTGEIASHAALVVSRGKNIVELGVAFTKPEFRHQGCFNRICKYLMSVAKKEEIKGIYATAVTIHPFSQKAILKNGFKECGILIGMAYATMFRDSLEHGRQRESTVLLFHDIKQLLDKPLYAPERHKEILKALYSNMGLPVKWREIKKPRKATFRRRHSVIETKIDSMMGRADIYVMEYGSDILKELRRILGDLVRAKAKVIYLCLDLCSPLTAILLDDIEKMDFMFAGVLPSGARQNLILQNLTDIRIDYDKICTSSDFASELLSYIKTLHLEKSAKK